MNSGSRGMMNFLYGGDVGGMLYKMQLAKTKKACSLNKLFLWCHLGSNQGHKDFQSFALPAELWHQLTFYLNL